MNVPPKDKDLRGWLRRRMGLMKIWSRRWFVLTDGFLFMFMHDDDKKIQDCIILCGQIIVEPPLDPSDPRLIFFDIVTEDDRNSSEALSLCAETEEEKKIWVRALKRALYADKGGALFSQSLEEILYWEHRAGRHIPYIVDECVEYLYKYGLDVEGIFRLPGRQTVAKDIMNRFERGQKVRFEDESTDVHVVASVLKTFLRSLPDSIIPCHLFQTFMNIGLRYTAGKDEASMKPLVLELIEAVKLIPKDNYTILKYICRFLREVAHHESMNKMSMMSIGTVFSYNLLRHIDVENNQLFLLTADLGQNLVYLLLKYYIQVFTKDYNDIEGGGNSNTGENLLYTSYTIDTPVLMPEVIDLSSGLTSHERFDVSAKSSITDSTVCNELNRITDDCLLFTEHCESDFEIDGFADNAGDDFVLVTGIENDLNLIEHGETNGVAEHTDVIDVTEQVNVIGVTEHAEIASLTEHEVSNVTEHFQVIGITEQAAAICSYSSSSLTEDLNTTSISPRQSKARISRNRLVNVRRRPQAINLDSDEWFPQAMHSPGGINSEDVLNALALINTPLQFPSATSPVFSNSAPDCFTQEITLEDFNVSQTELNADNSIVSLKNQITKLKEELSYYKNCHRTQIASLKAQLACLKEKYEHIIETVQTDYRSRIKDLENKLSEEKKSYATVMANTIQLQETFNKYKMLYGDLP